ncbi:MAG TPA: MmcQ/YjbR family DNA-binding protein [Bryobacteraceae bacterium]|nr:MmcQ/YjbR family DNA-binding protein [Bryobacteraceae bacterium]
MSVEWVRRYCLSLPHTTEMVQWEHDLLFKVAGKMYAGMPLEPSRIWLSLKSTPEEFAELTERPGIIPAPYMARAFWIALEHEDALPARETKLLIRQSYDLVVAKLPKKTRAALGA